MKLYINFAGQRLAQRRSEDDGRAIPWLEGHNKRMRGARKAFRTYL